MELSDSQAAAVLEARRVLENAGLNPYVLLPSDETSNLVTPPQSAPLCSASSSTTSQQSRYEAPPATQFSSEQVASRANFVNRQTTIVAIVTHPLSAIVEFPESGESPGASIGHLFLVDPSPDKFFHPKLNIQYSLGGTHGARNNVTCNYLRNEQTKILADCTLEKITCESTR
ncbi:hypothetical protein HYPSUDRAFT_651282 [Hypholoma sublateritium FD-334 SS-4]|uniref:Uncharacterized protein n=1 Tax=Hypholoma sublateritium (strain FD-334 SS-4) TaxID=945553 RepID=A0A0D2P1C1_HYPSF|nr:hypothetical protein HYPSUDRAFT_651282 [Hypholoma sublateritium FD-334 SS-4]